MEEKLIELVRGNRVLYDKTHGGYKNIIVKERIWQEISASLEKPVDELKKRWKTLRDRYYRLLKEHKAETTSGSGQQQTSPYVKFKYFGMLSFLKDVKHSNEKTVGNFQQEDASDDSDIVVMETPPSRKSAPLKRKAESNIQKEMLDAIHSIKDSEEKESHIMMFMKSIAVQIEAADLPLESVLNLQTNILTVVKQEITGKNCTYEVEYV